MVVDLKNGQGGWKRNYVDIDPRKNQTVEKSFKELCASFDESEIVDCVNSQTFSTEEIVQGVLVDDDEANLR